MLHGLLNRVLADGSTITVVDFTRPSHLRYVRSKIGFTQSLLIDNTLLHYVLA